jgi:hypothetical protein
MANPAITTNHPSKLILNLIMASRPGAVTPGNDSLTRSPTGVFDPDTQLLAKTCLDQVPC